MQETPETQIQSLGQEDPLEEGMATHSSILARRIPWTEEPGGLQSTGSQSGHNYSDLANKHACTTFKGLLWCLSGKESTCQCKRLRFDPWVRKIPWRRKWQPTPVFLPRKSHGAWQATVHGVAKSECDLGTKQPF